LENEIKKNKSSIYRALLKYGYSQFSLEILEYCESENCIVREQYYLNLLPHEYNLLPNAGSLLGFKHSEETRAKQSIANKGEKNPRFPSEVKKQYIQKRRELNSQRLIKEKKIQCFPALPKRGGGGKARPIGSGSPSQRIEVQDLLTNSTIEFDSISAAGVALGIKSTTISNYITRNQKKAYKDRFIFIKI